MMFDGNLQSFMFEYALIHCEEIKIKKMEIHRTLYIVHRTIVHSHRTSNIILLYSRSF